MAPNTQSIKKFITFKRIVEIPLQLKMFIFQAASYYFVNNLMLCFCGGNGQLLQFFILEIVSCHRFQSVTQYLLKDRTLYNNCTLSMLLFFLFCQVWFESVLIWPEIPGSKLLRTNHSIFTTWAMNLQHTRDIWAIFQLTFQPVFQKGPCPSNWIRFEL